MRETAPLWKHGEVNPATPELQTLNEGAKLTFMPLEAVWPGGRADFSRTIAWSKKLSYTPFRRGDVLIPKITPTFEAGRSIVADIPTTIGLATTEVHVVRPRPGVDARYLCYVAQSLPFLDEGAHSLQGVGNLRRIAPRFVQEHRLFNAEPRKQVTIADYLDRETGEIDAMLGKMDELAGELNARRESVVMEAVDKHFNGSTVPLAFASNSENFFDGDWVESKDQDPNGDIRLLQLADIGVGKFLDKSDRRVNQEAFDRLACREVVPGDVLIARMPDPIGRACVLPTGLGRTITVVDVAVVRADREKMIPAYLEYVLNSGRFRTLIESLQGGSTRQRISRSKLGQQRIPVVSLDIQRATVDHLDEVTGRIDAMLAKVADLKSLLLERRAALITDVVTGKKEVA
ncbi:hypothetical protein [Isoptericola sp. BMS4]|uniref:restriction endonuclease subunit S n=1 Tax=Isoptericola sp. BMS4 TaxID=2527875 RepID=UPI001420E2E8|nr:hypothetical protein [Isoptericola sp. BMS4]